MELTWQEQIVLLRNRRGLTQQQFADEIGMSRGTLHSIETGKGSPRIEQLEMIAEALGITVTVTVTVEE